MAIITISHQMGAGGHGDRHGAGAAARATTTSTRSCSKTPCAATASPRRSSRTSTRSKPIALRALRHRDAPLHHGAADDAAGVRRAGQRACSWAAAGSGSCAASPTCCACGSSRRSSSGCASGSSASPRSPGETPNQRAVVDLRAPRRRREGRPDALPLRGRHRRPQPVRPGRQHRATQVRAGDGDDRAGRAPARDGHHATPAAASSPRAPSPRACRWPWPPIPDTRRYRVTVEAEDGVVTLEGTAALDKAVEVARTVPGVRAGQDASRWTSRPSRPSSRRRAGARGRAPARSSAGLRRAPRSGPRARCACVSGASAILACAVRFCRLRTISSDDGLADLGLGGQPLEVVVVLDGHAVEADDHVVGSTPAAAAGLPG